MVLASRLQFIVDAISTGASVRFSSSFCGEKQRSKIKVYVEHGAMNINETDIITKEFLEFLRQMTANDQYLCWDRGHRHSTGISEVCFFFQRRRPRAQAQEQSVHVVPRPAAESQEGQEDQDEIQNEAQNKVQDEGRDDPLQQHVFDKLVDLKRSDPTETATALTDGDPASELFLTTRQRRSKHGVGEASSPPSAFHKEFSHKGTVDWHTWADRFHGGTRDPRCRSIGDILDFLDAMHVWSSVLHRAGLLTDAHLEYRERSDSYIRRALLADVAQ
jgi:hypothetical protein